MSGFTSGSAASQTNEETWSYVPGDLAHLAQDPIFGNPSGQLQLNYWYSNNGARIVVDTAYGYPTTGNTDDIHGIGNEYGAGTSSGGGSGSWWHDVSTCS